jgi:hypothetical protein
MKITKCAVEARYLLCLKYSYQFITIYYFFGFLKVL